MLLNCGVGGDSWEFLGLQGDQTVNPRGNQSWIFIGRTDAEAEAPILWPPDVKNWLIGKDPGAWKDWRHKEKGTTEDEMVGWHHQLDGHEFEQALGVGDGQGSLVCCSPWAHKESDTTEQLNWTELNQVLTQGCYLSGIHWNGWLLLKYFCWEVNVSQNPLGTGIIPPLSPSHLSGTPELPYDPVTKELMLGPAGDFQDTSSDICSMTTQCQLLSILNLAVWIPLFNWVKTCNPGLFFWCCWSQ